MSVGPNGAVYRDLAERLQREIDIGRFAEAEQLPGERELAHLFGVSRTTLRRAILALVDEGLLFHRQGAGTFIRRAAPRVEAPISRLTGFTEDMAMRGFQAGSRELASGVFLPSPEEAMMLGVGPSESVLRLSRLRLADDVPMRFLPAPDDIGPSLYETLKSRGFGPARGLQRLRAALLPDADAALLGAPKGSPTLYIQRIAYLADGRGVEFTRSYYRADTYDFVSELTLAPQSRRSKA
jgi:GntR family transcriptional regulator